MTTGSGIGRRAALAGGLATIGGAGIAYAMPRERETLLPARDPAAIGPPPEQVAARTAIARSGEATLWHWDTGGAGPAVILLHPLTGSALSWPYQQPVLARAGFRVIGWSQRGAYRSPGPPTDRAGQTADLRAVMAATGVRKAHLVGGAAGAFTALAFALAEPNRVASLTIACSLGGLADPTLLARARALQFSGFGALPADARELGPSYRAANPDGVRRWLEIERGSAAHGEQAGGPDRLATLMAGPTLKDLAGLRPPVSLMYGDADLYAPPAIGRLLAAAIPGSDLTVLAEVGHTAHWEQPDLFNETLLRFLRHRSS